MPQKFRKKPVVIDAMQWDGSAASAQAILDWIWKDTGNKNSAGFSDSVLWIKTLESGGGRFTTSPRDWVIRGVQGEFYACRSDIFAATYEPAE